MNAGFLYTGDAWNVCVPLIAKVNSLVSHGAFFGIDFSTHGGASDLFLRPNLYPYHPLLILYSLISRSDAIQRLLRVSTLFLALHSFIGCYFAFLLSSRYLRLGAGAAIFVAVGYTFSFQMVCALGYPPYLFSAALLPWAVYGALATSDHFSLGRAVRHSLAPFIMLVGGYVPLAMSSVAMSWGFVALYLLYVDAGIKPVYHRVRLLAAATMPFVIAGIVVAPLYWSIAQYFSLVHSSSAVSVFFSAYQLAEQPRSILRLLSWHLYVPGPLYEMTIVWGIVPVIISILFFAGLKNTTELSEAEWRLYKVATSVFALIILAIYGNYSAVSDLLYFLPAIGTMHIYQRHLLAGQFFFIVAIALMFNVIVRRANLRPMKVTLFVLAALLLICAHLVAENSPAAKAWHLNDYIVFELLLGVLFTASLIVHNTWLAFIVGSFFIFLGPLDSVYDYSTAPENRIDVQRTRQVQLDEESNKRVLSYFRMQSHKAVVKYVDLLPGSGPADYFSRNYPWFQAMDLPLSTYGGYDFLLAQRDSYGRRMSYVPLDKMWMMRPDWAWVARTGGEFVVYKDGFPSNDPRLAELIDLSDPARVLRLRDNIVIAPLRTDAPIGFGPGVIHGRYVRVQLADVGYLSLAEVRVIGSGSNADSNVALGKTAVQSSTASGGLASKAVDGITNGDFNAGSVTHTGLDPYAWWQVDLGQSVAIKNVEIWNRTDGASERLGDYWVFISEKPFSPTDTPAELQHRTGIFSAHQTTKPDPATTISGTPAPQNGDGETLFDNGYLRIIGVKGSVTVKGFRTDGAARLSMDLTSSKPAKIQYLFWPNERLRFYLNGKSENAMIEDGLLTVNAAAGLQRLEIRYEYWPLRLFLLLYLLYAVTIATALIGPVVLATKRKNVPVRRVQ